MLAGAEMNGNAAMLAGAEMKPVSLLTTRAEPMMMVTQMIGTMSMTSTSIVGSVIRSVCSRER